MGLGKYIKKAFLNQWNLLVFLGGMGFAMLSGHPDVFVPLVMAGELAYVGVLGTHPTFQRRVDIEEHMAAKQQGSAAVSEAFDRILKALPRRQLRRFQNLRERCASLRQIAQQMRASEELSGGSSPAAARRSSALGPGPPALDLPSPALHPDHARAVLRANQRGADPGRDPAARSPDRPHAPPMRHTAQPRARASSRRFEDNLETCRGRLANLQKAKENFELVEAEIERLENKINSITEMAINRQDPQFVSGQVDQVADSLVQTEQAMNDLQFATGLDPIDDVAPSIFPRGLSTETAMPEPIPN